MNYVTNWQEYKKDCPFCVINIQYRIASFVMTNKPVSVILTSS